MPDWPGCIASDCGSLHRCSLGHIKAQPDRLQFSFLRSWGAWIDNLVQIFGTLAEALKAFLELATRAIAAQWLSLALCEMAYILMTE